MKVKIKKTSFVFLFFAAALLAFFFYGSYFFSKPENNPQPDTVAKASNDQKLADLKISQNTTAPKETNNKNTTAADNSKIVNARSYIAVKVENGNEQVLLGKNEDKEFPVASLVKMMTALVVLENYNLEQRVTVNQEAMSQMGEQGNLKFGEVLSVKNLLYIMLIESSNRAAYQLSDIMGQDKFIALMNQRAKDLGLFNTHFEDSSGLDAKSYSTARDLAKLSEYLFSNYPLFGEITGLKEYNLYLDNGQFDHKLINTNQLLGQDFIISGKTGWTNEAKGCFMAIEKNPNLNGAYFINIILGSDDRFSEMKKLISLAKE